MIESGPVEPLTTLPLESIPKLVTDVVDPILGITTVPSSLTSNKVLVPLSSIFKLLVPSVYPHL